MGDLVNYGPNPAQVIDFVREKAAVVLRGDHDHSIGFDEDPRCSARFREMAEETGRFTRSVLKEAHRTFLRHLPLGATVAANGLQALMCHATPADPLFEYRREDSPLWLTDAVGPEVDLELVGHTHLPFDRAMDSRRIVNPGSVGQAKHGKPEACYATWQDGLINLHSVPYDIEQTVEKLRRLALSLTVFEDLAFTLRNGVAPPAPAL